MDFDIKETSGCQQYVSKTSPSSYLTSKGLNMQQKIYTTQRH